MSRTWHVYAHHILDAIRKIRRIEQRCSILDDDLLYDAALRNLQTLSEAKQKLPEEQKARFPSVPWREISGFRNILVHNYLGDIDPLAVSSVISKHLKAIEDSVQAMLDVTDRQADSSNF
jgi:uncharacterized protein with HEPN domain